MLFSKMNEDGAKKTQRQKENPNRSGVSFFETTLPSMGKMESFEQAPL